MRSQMISMKIACILQYCSKSLLLHPAGASLPCGSALFARPGVVPDEKRLAAPDSLRLCAGRGNSSGGFLALAVQMLSAFVKGTSRPDGCSNLCAWLKLTVFRCASRTQLRPRWDVPAVRKIQLQWPCVTVHYCGYGTSWKKPTKILGINCNLKELEGRQCHSMRGICSHSSLPRTVLSGFSKEHNYMWTSVASAYPPMLRQHVIKLLSRS